MFLNNSKGNPGCNLGKTFSLRKCKKKEILGNTVANIIKNQTIQQEKKKNVSFSALLNAC